MAFSSKETQLLELKDMLSQLNKTVAAQAETIASLQRLLEETQALAAQRQEQIDYLTRKLFGASSEKKSKQEKQADGQLTLFDMYSQIFNEAEYNHAPDEQEEETVVIKEHTRKSKRSNKDKFKDLEVEEVIIDLPEEEQNCSVCGTPMEKVGKEYVREELIYIPAELKLVKYYRTTYKCPACTDGFTPDVDHHFVKSEVPTALIPHGFASESMVSWCMYQKYVLAVPLYRQEQNWLQFNVELSRTTMANWVIYCSEHYLVHIYNYFHRELLKRQFLMADETRIQVLKEPDRRAQTQSFMWVVRSGEDGLPVIILFGYTETRARYNIEKFLEGYPGGYLETDGYQGYNKLKNIKRCSCWSHIRRDFYDAIPKGKKSDLSQPSVQAVQYCDKLFRHDRYCAEKGFSHEQRKEYRLKKSKPVIDSFFQWLDKQITVKGSRLDSAVKYAQNQKKNLYTYLEDGRCSLSNNLTENSIRPFTVGRKNWLFAATPEGANASAIVYSIVEIAKAHNLSIYKYLSYLLEQRPSGDMTDEQLALMTPWNQEVRDKCSK